MVDDQQLPERTRRLLAYLNAIARLVRMDDPDLTSRQFTVFLKCYMDDRDQTVRGLARYCKISKPAITRALDRLTSFDLVQRKVDPQDRRSVIVQRTIAGRRFLREFGEILMRVNSTVIEDD